MKSLFFFLAIVMMPSFTGAQVPNDSTIMVCKPEGYTIEEIEAFALKPTGVLNSNYRKITVEIINAGLDSCGCNPVLTTKNISSIMDSSYIDKVELFNFENSGAKGDSIAFKPVPYYYGPVVIYRNRSCPIDCYIPFVKDTCGNLIKADLIKPLVQDVPTFTSNGKTKAGGLDPANAGGPQGGNANGGNGQTQPVVVNVYLNADGTVASAKKDSTATPPVTTPVATPTGPMTVPVNVNTTTSYADSDSHQEVESYGKKHPKWCMDCHQKWRKCACRRYAEANQRSGYSSYSSVGNVLGACAGCGLHLGINHCGVGIGVGFNAGISGYQNSCPPQFPRSYISPGRPLTYDNRGLIQYVGGPTWTGHVVNGFTGYQ